MISMTQKIQKLANELSSTSRNINDGGPSLTTEQQEIMLSEEEEEDEEDDSDVIYRNEAIRTIN